MGMSHSLQQYEELKDLKPNTKFFIEENKKILDENDEIMKRNKIIYDNNIKTIQHGIRRVNKKLYN